ncbi:MAG: hypothetical protein JSR58_01050 [Verrucomicrobia bacterium]|nr:hypothetical protein [Verrucomicrobiota bacterium]
MEKTTKVDSLFNEFDSLILEESLYGPKNALNSAEKTEKIVSLFFDASFQQLPFEGRVRILHSYFLDADDIASIASAFDKKVFEVLDQFCVSFQQEHMASPAGAAEKFENAFRLKEEEIRQIKSETLKTLQEFETQQEVKTPFSMTSQALQTSRYALEQLYGSASTWLQAKGLIRAVQQ